MPSSEAPASIHLTVKVPPGYLTSSTTDGTNNTDHFDLGELPVNTTIGTLRQHLSQAIPTNPPPERQRILYAGRALVDNEQTLADALNTKREPTQREYVVHLIIKADGAPPSRTPTPSGQHVRSRSAHGQQQQQQNVSQGQETGGGGLSQHEQLLRQHQNLTRQLQMQQQMIFQQFAQQQPQRNAHLPGVANMLPSDQRTIHQPTTQPQGVVGNGEGVPNATLTTQHENQPQNTIPPNQDHQQQTGQNLEQQQQQQHLPPNQRRGPAFHLERFGPAGQHFQIHQQTVHFPHMPGMPGGPAMGMPANNMPQAMPMQYPPPGFGMPQPHAPSMPLFHNRQYPPGPSALDRARENMAEMRRMLDELAAENQNQAGNESADAEDQQRRRQRIEDVQQRAQRLNEYIDPLNLGTTHTLPSTGANTTAAGGGRGEASPRPFQQNNSTAFGLPPTGLPPTGLPPTGLPPTGLPPTGLPPLPTNTRLPPRQAQTYTTNPSDPDEVSVYLLSSPQGPEALLISPRYGMHVSTPRPTATIQQPYQPGTTQPPDRVRELQNQILWQIGHAPPAADQTNTLRQPQEAVAGGGGAAAAEAEVAQPAPFAQPGQQQQQPPPVANDPQALQAILNHFWLFVRILIFAYFLLGTNLGWQRPVILLGIGVMFWVIRMGVLADAGFVDLVQRWWEGVVGQPLPRAVGREQQGGQGGQGGQEDVQARVGVNVAGGGREREGGAVQPQVGTQAQPAAEGNRNGNGNPAQTMPTPEQVAQRLLAQAEERNQQRRNWLREQIRPVERAVALFIASLWPGIGEAHVREQRRLREEEEAAVARRRAEEEERRVAEEEKGKGGDSGEVERVNGEDRDCEGGEKIAEGSAEANDEKRA